MAFIISMVLKDMWWSITLIKRGIFLRSDFSFGAQARYGHSWRWYASRLPGNQLPPVNSISRHFADLLRNVEPQVLQGLWFRLVANWQLFSTQNAKLQEVGIRAEGFPSFSSRWECFQNKKLNDTVIYIVAIF